LALSSPFARRAALESRKDPIEMTLIEEAAEDSDFS
jgi:hypothetical protein